MDLPSPNQNETKPVIPEMNGPLPQEHRAPGAQWLRLAVVIIVGLLVLALLFLGGRWTYRKIAHHSSKPATTTSSPTQNSSGSNQQSGSTPTAPSSGTPAPANSGGSQGSTSTTQSGSAAQTGTNGKLSNTGPGSTAALFTIATATGVITYQVVLRRRTE